MIFRKFRSICRTRKCRLVSEKNKEVNKSSEAPSNPKPCLQLTP